jgi:4-nitrophenol 2-monooxygenase / 4-nitrocatechol 4-monooxygenase, reductase component
MASGGPAQRPVAIPGDEFRSVIGHFAAGVAVVTAAEGDRLYGTTASAVCSLSLEPSMVLICMNRNSATGRCVNDVKRFAINILTDEQQHLAQQFASKANDKFDGVEVAPGTFGEPLIVGALAHAECTVTDQISGGSHEIFIGEVHRASARTGGPLVYYRGAFGRLRPFD